jgi:transcription elongation regulator 1
MLKELKHLHRHSSWTETRRQIESDSRYRAIESSTKREDYFRDYVRSLDSNGENEVNSSFDEEKERKEKQDRIDASIKEREKEVREQMSKINTERDAEREKLKHDEAVECFKAMLVDLVKQTDGDWKETKKQLKRDSRYDFCKSLDKDEKEKLFDEHVQILRSKRKDQFYQLLDETQGVSLSSSWKEVKKLVKSDQRYEKLVQTSDLKFEKEFDNYIHEKYQKAKHDFKELLKDTKIITYKYAYLLFNYK